MKLTFLKNLTAFQCQRISESLTCEGLVELFPVFVNFQQELLTSQWFFHSISKNSAASPWYFSFIWTLSLFLTPNQAYFPLQSGVCTVFLLTELLSLETCSSIAHNCFNSQTHLWLISEIHPVSLLLLTLTFQNFLLSSKPTVFLHSEPIHWPNWPQFSKNTSLALKLRTDFDLCLSYFNYLLADLLPSPALRHPSHPSTISYRELYN